MCTWPLPNGQTNGKKDPLCQEKRIEREDIHPGSQCSIVDSGFLKKVQYNSGLTSCVTFIGNWAWGLKFGNPHT